MNLIFVSNKNNRISFKSANKKRVNFIKNAICPVQMQTDFSLLLLIFDYIYYETDWWVFKGHDENNPIYPYLIEIKL